jgi:ATP-dependent protease ClpP protease subunit
MAQPIRCFEGSARPQERFWTFRDAASPAEEPELELYGVISEYSWWGDEVTPQMFRDDLQKYGRGGPVTVRINSVGGELVAASVMRAALIDYKGRVTVRIDGLAASAATLVALAGDVIRIQDSGFFMIHDPSVNFFLQSVNIDEMTKLLDELKRIKSSLVDIYAEKTGLSKPRLEKLLSNETWLTAREAVDMGFADEVITGSKKEKKPDQEPQNRAFTNVLRTYANVPAGLINQPVNDLTESVEIARLRAEAQILMG